LIVGGILAFGLVGCGGHKGAAATSSAATSTTASVATTTTTAAHKVVKKSAYETTMVRLGRTLSTSLSKMYPLVDDGAGSDANKEAVARVESARTTVVAIATTLAGVVAPAPIRADQKKLLAGLGTLQDELDTLIQALQHGNAKPIGALANFAALQTIAQATADMTRKGYAVE
jgi:hypothetical protein